MNEKLFSQLVESLKQGDAILKGEAEPSRRVEVHLPATEGNNTQSAAQVRELRRRFGLSQKQFADVLGISAGTLRNWEQGRRAPEGSARVLLRVVARHPQAVLEVNAPDYLKAA
jgi:putative transcriptional regulator